MLKPTIAITTNFTSEELKNDPESTYANAIKGAGGIPILIPRDLPVAQYAELREHHTGILLTGGGDLDLRYFDGEPNPAIGIPSPQRDELELALVKMAIDTDWPLLGICRGVQVLNVALGGTLFTDIPTQFQTGINHSTPADKGRYFLAHQVKIAADSTLATIMKTNVTGVNSFHHQAIKELAPGLKVSARATDGLIEAVEFPGMTRSVIGVQWHPENLQAIQCHKALFEEFVHTCK
jgi:putative glutamine amidotransferase